MKAPQKELRAYVYGLLYNKVAVTGVTGFVQVASIPSKSEAFPWVDLGNIALIDLSTKDRYITKAIFEINIYTLFADENTSYTQCELIANEIMEKLIDVRGETANFKIIAARFISSQESFEQTETQKAISNQILIEFTVEQI
jgi:hypothetical protein